MCSPNLWAVSADADLRAGASVAGRDARQRGARVGSVLLALQDGLRQGGDVHPSVTLARDEEGVASELGEQAEEDVDGLHVLCGRAVVVAGVVPAGAVAEAHSHGGLDVQHVHQQIPAHAQTHVEKGMIRGGREGEGQTICRGAATVLSSRWTLRRGRAKVRE